MPKNDEIKLYFKKRLPYIIGIVIFVFIFGLTIGPVLMDKRDIYWIDINGSNHIELKGTYLGCYSALNGVTVKRTKHKLLIGPVGDIYLNLDRSPGSLDDNSPSNQYITEADFGHYKCILLITEDSFIGLNYWGDPELERELKKDITTKLNELPLKRISYGEFKEKMNHFRYKPVHLKKLSKK